MDIAANHMGLPHKLNQLLVVDCSYLSVETVYRAYTPDMYTRYIHSSLSC